jgi:2',3'-cyclic-nucleotide 2'-phosphodiesterase (5'-nucleotidase family)
MKKISQNADLTVVLSSMPPKEEMEFIRKHPGIALLISSGRTSPTRAPIKWNGCLIVSSHPRGKSVGHIKLFLKKEARGYSVARCENSLHMLEKGK